MDTRRPHLRSSEIPPIFKIVNIRSSNFESFQDGLMVSYGRMHDKQDVAAAYYPLPLARSTHWYSRFR